MKNSTRNIRKILSIALCLALVLSCVPVMALGADGVSYINENGEQQTYTGAYTEVTSDLTSWSNGWFVVSGAVTIESRITVSGTVNLILTDGAQLTASQGIAVNGGNTFIIYAQSEAESTMGSLVATGGEGQAGIGGNASTACGTVTVNGGIVNAQGGDYGAGIGGGEGYWNNNCHGGTVTVNGGSVNAQGGDEGAGIGGGCYSNGGIVTINGGSVNAQGGDYGAGIGGSDEGNGGTLIVNGGIVNAKAGRSGAGIGGGGYKGAGGNVTVNGGIVIATTYGDSWDGDPIGGGGDTLAGKKGEPGTLTINEGIVFQNGIGAFYGNEVIVEYIFRLESGQSLTINEGQTLTVDKGATFINHGELINNGTILNYGVIEDVNNDIDFGYENLGQGVIYREHSFSKGYCTICGVACTSHVMENGLCTHGCAGVYEAATEVSDKYDVDGDGYTDQVYEIANAGQLYWFAGLVNGTLTDIQQNTKANAVLTDDIIVNENVVDSAGNLIGDGSNFLQWTPIGHGAIFEGVFDGDGHTVSGLYFSDEKVKKVGLIGYGISFIVKNVGVVNSYLNALDNIGAIAGSIGRNGTVSDCYNLNTTIIHHMANYGDVGGIAGSISNYGSLNNCFSTGNVDQGIVGSVPSGNINGNKNNYYLEISAEQGTLYGDIYKIFETTPTTAEKFATGEIAYLLNNSSPDGIWRQTIGEDAYPNFNGEKVYYGYSCLTDEFLGYTNETAHPTQTHYDEKGYCKYCKNYQPATLNEDGYYEIYNVGQLYWFAEEVSSYNNNWTATYNAILMNDIVINENLVDENGNLTENTDNLREWRLIGNGSNTTFNGVFDGNYHTISGIYLDDTNASYSGLFGSIGNGMVKNLGITDSYINGKRSAAFAGWSSGTIENCFVTDTVIKGEVVDSFVASYSGTVSNYDYPCITKSSYSTALVYENGTQVDAALANEYISQNLYYLADSDNGNGGKTAKQFASGEVAYLLNGATSEGTLIWGQTIGTDVYPVWNGAKVYKGFDCGGTDAYYSNTELLGENDNNHIPGDWTYTDTDGVHQRYICTREGCPQYHAIETGNCSGGTATCQEMAICDVCRYSYGDYDYNNHTSQKTYMTEGDENGHKLYHYCCDKEISTTPHSYDDYDFDSDHHWSACECGYAQEVVKESHTFDSNGFCTVCGGYEPAPVVYNEESYSNVAEISNAGQLFWYAENWMSCPVYDEENDEYYETSVGAVLTKEIDLNPGYTFDEDGSYLTDSTAQSYNPVLREWKPIKNYAWVDFDGQGHTIRGLYINTPEERNVGMFAFNDYYTIKNITLTNGFVYGGDNTAALVGYNTGSVINCHSDIAVKGNGVIGGIVAYHSGSEVKNCSNTGSVIIYGSSSATGGIVGSVYGYSTVTNCYNTGYIKGGINVGGIVGDGDDADISNCYNTGIILSNYSDAHAISGGGTIENCYKLSIQDNGADEKTNAQFASGEVAYLLQANQNVEEIYDENWNVIGEEQEQVWGQDSNRPGATPIFDTTGLYKVIKIGETGKYSVANMGDTNADENVDITDYQALINTILAEDPENEAVKQLESASYDDVIRYDLDADGSLDALDASYMEKMVNGNNNVKVFAVGDFDKNGKAFEEADLSAIKLAILTPAKLSTAQKYACDINADGKVSQDDLIKLIGVYG